MPRKSSLRCYFGCTVDGPIHQFPTYRYPHEERFNTWKGVLSPLLQKRGNKYLRENIRLCYRHFEKSYQLPSRRLTANAIPTLQLHKAIEVEPKPLTSSDLAVPTPNHNTEVDILSDDSSTTITDRKNIETDISVRLQHEATSCQMKETRQELLEKYLDPQNCIVFGAPELNPEVKAEISEAVFHEDKVILVKEKQLDSAMSCILKAVMILKSAENKNATLIKLLTDASKILCNIQNPDSDVR